MDKSALKKVLAGLSIAGLVTSVTLTGCQKANGSCGKGSCSGGSCSKTEKVEGDDASEGTGSCTGMKKDDAEAGEGSKEQQLLPGSQGFKTFFDFNGPFIRAVLISAVPPTK